MGFAEVLTIIFVVMKLAGLGAVANWNWFQILLPEIIAIVFYVIVVVGYIAIVRWNK